MSLSRPKANLLLKVISLLIYLIFTCSAVYNFAFFLLLGISINQVPLTVNDIINSSFTWTPFAATTVAIAVFIALLTKRIEQGMTEEEIINSTPSPEKTKKMREKPLIFLKIIAIGALISFIFFGQFYIESLLSIFPFFMILWFWFGEKLSDHPRIFKRRNLWVQCKRRWNYTSPPLKYS